ncbi:hypothetical protein ACHQM5_026913 [Ranunculus cassubicifolius]
MLKKPWERSIFYPSPPPRLYGLQTVFHWFDNIGCTLSTQLNLFYVVVQPTASPPRWNAEPKSSGLKYQTHQGPPSVAPYANSLNVSTSTPVRQAPFQGPGRTRTPPFSNKAYVDDFTQAVSERSLEAPQRMSSPPQTLDDYHNVGDLHHPFIETHMRPTKPSNYQVPQKTRSPPVEHIWRNSHPSQGDTDRTGISPPRFGNQPNLPVNKLISVHQRSSFSPHNEDEKPGPKTMNSNVPKRNRSPSLASAEDHLPGTSYSTQDDTERELQAKAKRLARFGGELSQPVQSNMDNVKHKSPTIRNDQGVAERRKLVADQTVDAAGDFMLADYESSESSNVIIGVCPDMCPESERASRERKGDLDKYERLDGNRNQTSISLAVKKYTRTAEREADLIRPMPVLQQTIDYLLALLDQPYDDRFLGMYNFLWDRMRAIRMDLRMQHIFNQEAIVMLEQMIRLHIIAMHELCEYNKGEGFSEGFDAHLNIEQMNKTSVELFQMYDDHRKKGITVLSEKEFRGYYALLKLDKHPGYKVEPAELSLDLAKMTPEIRQTPEILFARDVARACRTGNFIAFFRLARRATYLQACLMHAHFAKLRTQALASLHSGLQINQGIPVAHVTKWLGMEEEDIEDLLEYHGFLIKDFGEPYMVKEGLFFNSDKDYPTRCSRLVHLKKSEQIMTDVFSSNQFKWPTKETMSAVSVKKVKLEPKAVNFAKSFPSIDVVDEVMSPVLTIDSQVRPTIEVPSTGHIAQVYSNKFSPRQQSPKVVKGIESDRVGSEMVCESLSLPSPMSPKFAVEKVGEPDKEMLRNDSLKRVAQSPHFKFGAQQTESPTAPIFEPLPEVSSSQELFILKEKNETFITEELVDEDAILEERELQNEEDMMRVQQDYEVAMAKLILILRKWKRNSSKQKELREKRQLAANAALSSLTLGPPIQQIQTSPSSRVHELDIERAMRERRERQKKSWSRMNISDIVGNILSSRNPHSKCLCWKLIICSEGDRKTNHMASLWLHLKLKGLQKDNENELVICTQDFSMWSKWFNEQLCLSIVREAKFDMLEDDVSGASGVLFLVSESSPLEAQKTQLHSLLTLLPSGSALPLLILCSSQIEEIVNGLGLHNVDKTRVSNFLVKSILDDLDGFYSSERLTEGLTWLASNSPVQPVVHCIKTRELVMDHLSISSLRVPNNNVVGPNDCILRFNQALDISATEIISAARTNATRWPCIEMNNILEPFVPSVGWSSEETISPILSRIESCRLPFFSHNMDWLNTGSDTGEEILSQKFEFENCLARYLAEKSKMMDETLARTEASVIIQKGVLLELQGSKYYFKPNWTRIFRRVFNWRLMNLSSEVYVLKERNLGAELEEDPNLSTHHQPSLDEMIQVCFNTAQFRRPVEPVVFREIAEQEKSEQVVEFSGKRKFIEDDKSEEMVVSNKVSKEADKLGKLLEQCNIVQNKIDEQLFIYF